MRDGAVAAAAEHALAGLAWAPTLPEALALVATIARKRGDEPLAKSMFAAWLDGGADLPQLADDVRGFAGR